MSSNNPLELLDEIYSTAIEPERWPTVMQQLADRITGSSAWLVQVSFVDGSGARFDDASVRIDPVWKTEFIDHYGACNPLNIVQNPARFASGWRPRVLTDEDWMAKEDLVRTEYYNDYMKPHGTHSAMMVRLAIEGVTTVSLNFGRAKRHGQFTSADIETINRYHPHLLRAFGMGQKLLNLRRLQMEMADSLDLSPHAMALLDGTGRVRRLNKAAEQMVRRGSVLRVRDGQLQANTPAATARLQGLIAAAASPDAQQRTGGSMGFAAADRSTPFSVTVTPILTDAFAMFSDRPSVLVCVTDLEASTPLPERPLRDLFGLTAAETRLALALFDGASPNEAAERFGVSRHTVHSQLAQVFLKTDTRRQSELLRLLSRVAVPFRADRQDMN
jgi:DNA-binding CsgD family transcriptional regulator